MATRNTRYTTDKGEAVFPHLVEPDTKFDSDGVYQTKIRLPRTASIYDQKRRNHGTIEEVLDAMVSESQAKFAEEKPNKKVREAEPPYEIDGDDVIVKFKLRASGKTRDGKVFTQRPELFDAKGKRVRPERLWNGSIIKPAFEIVPYFAEASKDAGVTLRLKAVQILKLVETSSSGADDFGFGEEEGFDGDDMEEGSTDRDFDDETTDEEAERAFEGDSSNGGDF